MKIHEDRILFLREFTKELILNSKKEKEEKKGEKLIEPLIEIKSAKEQTQKMPSSFNIQTKEMPSSFNNPTAEVISTQITPFEISSLPENFYLEKIDALSKNPEVNMIESPGPDKIVMIRKDGKIESTNIFLNEEEIREILHTFSEAAKIPLEGGIFRAKIGNLSVSAVISDFVGSRFIISKTPIS